MNVSIPLLLHGNLKAAVQDLFERVDPILHLSFTVSGQQVGALILHLQLESKPPNLVALPPQRRRRLDKIRKEEKRGEKNNMHYIKSQTSSVQHKKIRTKPFCY